MDSSLAADRSHPSGPASAPCIAIDSGVPMPKPKAGPRIGPVRRALEALEVGQSFVAPTLNHDLRKTQVYTGRTGQFLKPKKFSTRIVEENGKRVVRIWRVA